ncbi:MAG: TonB-dependent receptor [Methylophilales bacterium]|nr:TonB-dependent receptor [Methylophilales bacterium]
MNLQNQPSKHSINYKLKPISLIVFSLFAQQAFAQSELVQDNVSLALTKQLADSSVKASKPSVQNNNKKSVKIVVADASTAVKSKSNAQYKTNTTADASPDVYDVLLGDDPGANVTSNNIPSAADRYGATKEMLKTAAVSDANSTGTGSAAKDKAASKSTVDIDLKSVTVRAKRLYEVGPLPGLGLTKEEIPGNVQSITAKEIKESHSVSLADLMNSHLQSVNVNDYQGNPFQMDVSYRGFTASPQLGTAQGISVYLDGIRVNEPFGDVVNWDMIPMNALSSLDVFPGSNPLFGLGTLGGALAMRTKSGYLDQGVDAEILAGAYGRKQLQISAGGNNGVIAGFASGNFFLEDGWRDNSPSKVNQVFGKAEWRNEKVQLSLSMLYAGNKLTGNGLLPQQMADQNRSQVYTSPDTSKNDLLQFQLSGIWDVTDTFNVTGQLYHRNSKRKSKTTDVNDNFDGAESGNTTGKQVLNGYQDINNDGLPDYNNTPINVAADASGQPLTNNGAVCTDPLDACMNDLAVGTSFGTKVTGLESVQGEQQALDGSGNPVFDSLGNPVNIPIWVSDPRVNAFDFTPSTVSGVFNGALPAQFYQFALNAWKNKAAIQLVGGGIVSFGGSHPSGNPSNLFDATFEKLPKPFFGTVTDNAGFLHNLTFLPPINDANLDPNFTRDGLNSGAWYVGALRSGDTLLYPRDGAHCDAASTVCGVGTGVVEGTPNALITETDIDQVGTGGSLQLNWNLEKHKFMVGGSVDIADAKYGSAEYLGILDSKRNGVAAPNLLGYEYYARDAAHALRLNDFSGDSITKSLYTSETWTPTKQWNITAAARYNLTTVSNQLAVNRGSQFGAGSFFNLVDIWTLCKDANGDGVVDPATECPTGIPTENLLNAFSNDELAKQRELVSDAKETFHYHSFNPALGVTWQANENLNLYSNWNRGARTPSVIELGCAYDSTLVKVGEKPDGTPILQERSIVDRRTCNLPSTMSGDPYLKQVRSETFELGARGNWSSDIEWNASVYRTALQDDIYFVSVSPSRSYFQNIGDTRRQGLEMGLKGKVGKARFGINYSLTDATFQSSFKIVSPYNSTAVTDSTITILPNGVRSQGDYQQINVNPGNRMAGIPLHNLNANFSYDLTNKWSIGLNAVMHSSAFARGNENNQHQAGPAKPTQADCLIPDPNFPGTFLVGKCDIPHADWGPGKTAGYTVFNLQSSYKLDKGLTLGLQINNLFNKEYASAGRLGLNAFSPSIYGAIGPSGFNYNSNDWQGTSFLGLGAPRSAYVSLTYEFNPGEKF